MRLYLPDAVATNSTLFLSKIWRIGPEAADDAPVTLSPLYTAMLPLAKHLRKVFGARVFSDPGTMFLAGFSASTLVMYAFTGILVLFLLKKKSTPVTKHPPSRFSTLKVCARGLGLIGLSVLLSIN